MKRHTMLMLATAVALGACDKKTTEPAAPVVSQVSVTPATLLLTTIGGTGSLTASVLAGSTAVPNATVSWTSSAPAVATVSGTGLTGTVTSVSEGTAMITAKSGNITSTAATITVATPKQLTVTTAGTGGGAVNSAPAGITCTRAASATTGTCNASFASATAVTLAATPAAGSTFAGWTGSCAGTAACAVTMDQARSVTATFTANPAQLNVTVAGTGAGTVASTPAGVACTLAAGATTGTCAAPFTFASNVTLAATPAAGSTFAGWTGACTGAAACAVTMDQARTVGATFTLITNAITITLAGVGDGIVTSSPDGVNCARTNQVNSGTCAFSYTPGTSVTLTATGNIAMVFAGWSGTDCTGTATCVVTMDQARSGTATFDNPCTLVNYTLGATVNGTVNAAGCPRVGTPTSLYRFTVAAPTIYRIEATSTNATTRVVSIVPSFGASFASAASTAPSSFAVVAAGTYMLGVAQGTPGATYSMTTTPNPVMACESIAASLGITLDGIMSTAPACTAYTPTGLPAAAARTVVLTLPANKELRVTLTSTAFQPVVELRDGTSGAVVKTTAGDAATGTATFTFTNTFTNGYRIMLTSRANGSTGAYRLVIDP